jgi:type IV pilus assembly protein PilA
MSREENVMSLSELRRLRAEHVLEGRETAESGFTLIELMVVLLIIAILLAIAIPTFLGVTSSANDRSAQSNLTNGLTEATAQYEAASQTYAGAQTQLSASAPEYSWSSSATNCASSTSNCISIDAADAATSGDNQGVVLSSMSKTGTCWWVAELQAGPVSIPSTGFIQAATNQYSQNVGGALITKAGTYYAKKTKAGTNCYATYIEVPAAGFNWGSSFSTAGVN